MSSVDRRRCKFCAYRKFRPCLYLAAIFLIVQIILLFCIYRVNILDANLASDESKFSIKKDDPTSHESNRHYAVITETQRSEQHGKSKILAQRERSSVDYVADIDSTWPYIKINDPSTVAAIIPPKASNELNALNLEPVSLNISDLGFKPQCEITVKETLSALKRAKTLQCKLQIVNTSCLYSQEKLYPKRLPMYCSNSNAKKGDYIGCYQDTGSSEIRILQNLVKVNFEVTPERCIDSCLQTGYRFAGIENGKDCYCGDDYPPSEYKELKSECNTPCSDGSTNKCGGQDKISVFHTSLKKSVVGISTGPPSESSSKVKVLYMLTLNGRAIRQVRRLIKSLYHIDAYFYIHVDARQEYLFNELLPLEKLLPNVRLARRRFASIWGGASYLGMLLACMKEAMAFDDWHWDYLINLSESDFPLKTNLELVKFLTARRGKNFLKSHGRDTRTFITKQGLDQTFVECDFHMWRIGSRELPRGIRIDGGSDWIVINRDFCHYILNSKDELITGLTKVYKNTLLGAESFFHTVLRNSEMCNTFTDNNLHITNWQRDLGCRCQYKHVVDWCGCSPNAFKLKDLSRLKNSRLLPVYFARKFDPLIDQTIIDQVEFWLFGPRPENQLGLSSYWQNEFHYNISSPTPDDTFLTAYHTFSRLSISLLEDLASRCSLTAGKILEATLYNEYDKFTGTIITFEATVNFGDIQEAVQMETQVRPRSFFQTYELIGPTNRLKTLEVSTSYDHKERILRNYGKILGVYSEPCLVHEWVKGEAFAATFVWIDSSNVVAGSFEVKIESAAAINYHKPTFQTPLRPGIWTVKFMYQWKTMAETKFMVFPLAFELGVPISFDRTKLVNNGPEKSYVSHNFENVEKLLGLYDKRISNISQKSGKELNEWIDKLTALYFTVQDTCYVKASASTLEASCLAISLDPCENVPWSTKYPDPKSVIQFNPKTGLLER